MRAYVNDVLAPYFDRKKAELSLPPSQKSVLQLDVWSVHCSEEFRSWMKTHHPTILLDYVPGGCTGVAHPCDVGIQRPLKLSIEGNMNQRFKESSADLRNRTPRWLWNAYNALQDKEMVKKALRNMKDTDPAFWAELTGGATSVPDETAVMPEDVEPEDTNLEDNDSDD
ncbi:hypothetical protein CVT26_004631 [Gymnopilus dilepis]|uniref:DDE-1 domain-containing protein n=1 Tax=Gymnopilus dilepis TaxID=231916 RepID=A0A409YTS4_9AGAR|nr:hypothetical protein CVT26_004631 [Gymnopilus dilepis]